MLFVTVTHHMPYSIHHMGLGSDLGQGRKDVCTQIFNYSMDMYNL